MIKQIRPLNIVLALCLFGALVYIVYLQKGGDRIVFVRSGELIYGYAGMKEAQTEFQMQEEGKSSRVDTLTLAYEKAHQAYLSDLPNLSPSEKMAREKTLVEMRNGVIQYSSVVEKSVKEKEADLLKGVLTQINTFVEQYAKEKGYAMVIGTTDSGNLLYGAPENDITDELLKALNEQYNGQEANP